MLRGKSKEKIAVQLAKWQKNPQDYQGNSPWPQTRSMDGFFYGARVGEMKGRKII